MVFKDLNGWFRYNQCVYFFDFPQHHEERRGLTDDFVSHGSAFQEAFVLC